MKTVLVRTGKFRPDDVERSQVQPDGIVSSIAQLPDWLDGPTPRVRVGVDLIEIERIRRALARHGEASRSGASRRPSAPTATRSRTRRSTTPGRFAAKEAVGKALGSGVYFTWKEIEVRGRPKPGVHLSGRTAAWARRSARGRSSCR